MWGVDLIGTDGGASRAASAEIVGAPVRPSTNTINPAQSTMPRGDPLVSIRVSLRWVPEPAFEDTDTLIIMG